MADLPEKTIPELEKQQGAHLYTPAHAIQAYKLYILGMTDAEIADFFFVDPASIRNWKEQHPAFREAFLQGTVGVDCEVAERLYKRAVGYKYKEKKVIEDEDGNKQFVKSTKEALPDVRAAQYWLNNRGGGKWRNQVDHKLDGKIEINIDAEDDGL